MIELFREACRRDFWTFLNYGFGIKAYMREHPENPWLVERVHRPMAEWFQWHVQDWLKHRKGATRRKKLKIIWPRGFGKTTTITKAGNLWLMLQDPDISTLIDSVTYTKSTEFLSAIRDVLDGTNPYAWFNTLYGRWAAGAKNWRTGSLTHNQRRVAKTEPSFGAISVETGATGLHPDAVFIDDPVTKEKLLNSDGWHETVIQHVDSLIPVVLPNGLVCATATRYADGDWLGNLIREEGVRSVSGMPVLDREFEKYVVADGQWDLFFMQARDQFGKPVLPETWDDQALKDYERKNPIDYASQMMNEPGEGSHMPLTWADIDMLWCKAEDVPKSGRFTMHMDMAFKSKERVGRGDFNVIQIWFHDRFGEVYYVDGRRSNEWSQDEFGDAFIAMLQRVKAKTGQRIRAITYDEEIGGLKGSIKRWLKNLCAEHNVPLPPCFPQRRNRKKDTRLRDAAMYWKEGRVHLVRSAPEVKILASEMARIGVSIKRDMADAAADVFAEDIYKPENRAGEASGNYRPKRAWDEELLGGHISTEAARYAYDKHFAPRRKDPSWAVH